VIRGLSDAQLAKRGTVLTDVPPITVEEIIERVLIAHCEQHFGSIRRTIAPYISLSFACVNRSGACPAASAPTSSATGTSTVA